MEYASCCCFFGKSANHVRGRIIVLKNRRACRIMWKALRRREERRRATTWMLRDCVLQACAETMLDMSVNRLNKKRCKISNRSLVRHNRGFTVAVFCNYYHTFLQIKKKAYSYLQNTANVGDKHCRIVTILSQAVCKVFCKS